jgi:glycosyltransferase involved in cell wall biosynthesis
MYGGEGIYTYGLAKALSDLGHNVDVITTELKDKRKSSDFNIIYVPITKKPGLKLFSFNINIKKKIEEIARNKKIDVLHHTNDYYFINDVNLPLISTIHHPYKAERKVFKANSNLFGYLCYLRKRKIYFLERMEKKSCEKADKIIAVSRYTSYNIIKEYSIQDTKIKIIPNAVDINRFNPEIDGHKIRERFNIQSEPLVLFVGRLDINKGILYLIDAFSKIIMQIPDAKLVIVGEGPLKNSILSRVNKLNLRKSVTLVGRVDEEDLPKVYAASDLVVLPSLMEGFGIVLLEAMASGRPCVVTRVGGTEEAIIDGENGFFVPSADPYSLSRAIYTLLTNDDLAKDFGRAGRKRVEKNFTWDTIAKETVDVYKEMSG